ncbi:MAG: TCP-1/cpn60 chaperonin family protein [Thermoproteota archaeon]|nr:TCP-1/cpn60 chaperonin family protein [Thermoproteota archaeon]
MSFPREGDLSSSSQQRVPILVLKEGTTESKGRQAQRNNITAAKLIADLVKSALGPRGMDKMLVSSIGDVTITNDGATILKEVDIEHPAAKMMVEVAKSVDNEVGDGTTSAVVLAGALIEKAEELISKRVHPTVIVEGYQMASEKAIEFLRDAATKLDDPAGGGKDKETLLRIAQTSMASKLVSGESPDLAKIVVQAVLDVAEERIVDEREGGETLQQQKQKKFQVDVDNIKVEKKPGGSLDDTQLVYGIILDKEVVHGGMPKRIQGAKIALINAPMEIEKTEMSAEIRISEPKQMHMFLEEENRMLKSMVDKVVAAGANIVLCQKGIDDIAQHYLSKAGIMAVRRIKESDMFKLAKATGARVVNNIDELTASDLGSADLAEERKVETDKWVFIEGCKNPKAVSILIRGGSQRVVDEAERSVHDAIMVVKDVLEYPYVIVGGGAPEALLAARLRDWSGSLSGRTQIAAYRFAEAIETIPITLAENAGMDSLDTQVQLRARVAESLEKRTSRQESAETVKAKYGINVIEGKVADVSKQNIFEPLAVKEQVVNSATEAASMILRIDDVIAASKPQKSEGPPGRGGMGAGGGEMGDYGE